MVKDFKDLRGYIAVTYNNDIDSNYTCMSRDCYIRSWLEEINLARRNSIFMLEPLSTKEFLRLVIAGIGPIIGDK